MKKVFFAFITLLIVIVPSYGYILDQVQDEIGYSSAVICDKWLMAQTFTAGASGQLALIDFCFESNTRPSPEIPPEFGDAATYPVTISIVETIDSVPCGTELGQVYVDQFSEGFTSVNFLSEAIFLTSGNQYGIVVSNDDPDRFDVDTTLWRGNDNLYPGGTIWTWDEKTGWTQFAVPPEDCPFPPVDLTQYDTVFRTYMVPEPTALVLLSAGAVLLRMRNSKRY